jgi:predicted ATPase
MLDEFADGVYFVDLSPLIDPDLVLSQVAWALGIGEALDRPLLATMQRYFRDKQILLVLDNFEHLLQAAPLLTELLASAGQLKVLATSRVRLHLRGEHELAVPPLALPDVPGLPDVPDGHEAGLHSDARDASGWAAWVGNEAVRLFVERAAQVQAGFGFTAQNARAVAEIVRRLDGLPLAIELAAARVRLLPPQAMLSRLENRLKLLVGGARDAAERQQTLRGAIDWSYELLREGEQQLFRRMAVFQGGRTLEALEAVCNYDGTLKIEMLEGVEGLVASSLLQQREGSYGEPRFWMLETIHEYAREKLVESGEASVLRREHALYVTCLAEEAEPNLLGSSAQTQWLNRLEDEHENVRAALLWASERARGLADGGAATEGEAVGDGEAGSVEAGKLGLRLAGALGAFWWAKALLKEGTDCLERALSLPDSILQACSVSSKIKALSAAGVIANRHHDYVSAGSFLVQVLALAREAGDKLSIANCLRESGELARLQADYPRARTFLEESIVLYEELGARWGRGMSLNLLGLVAREEGDYTAAFSLFEGALSVLRELGDKLSMGVSLGGMAAVFYLQGNYAASLAYEEKALALFSESPHNLGIAWCLYLRGLVAQAQGDYPAAKAHFRQSLALSGEVEDTKAAASRVAQLGVNAVATGRAETGARLLGAVQGVLGTLRFIGPGLECEDRAPYERAMASAREQLGDEAFEKAWQEGRAMSVEEAIDYALKRTPER